MITTFFHDKSEKFSADLEIEGTTTSKTKIRMVLEFNDNKNRLYYGTIDKNGKVEVKIPALNDIEETKGNAILEVIADSTFFSPWESEFEIKTSKTVKIKEARFEAESETKVKLIENKETKPIVVKSDLKEKISEKSKSLVNSILEIYKKENLRNRIKIKSSLEDKKFNDDTILWANTVFEDSNSQKAKICCYYIEKFKAKGVDK